MLPLAHAFSQPMFIATLWIFSMQAVDVGALLLSAWLELILQRRRCRVKDWPCSQAAIQVCDFERQTTVCDFVWLTFEVARLCLFVILCRAGCFCLFCFLFCFVFFGGGESRGLSCHLHAAAC